jgi:hypothetical protein
MEEFLMFGKKKLHPADVPENPKSPGLHFKVQLLEQGEVELSLSEKVALTLAPWLIVLLGLSLVGAGVWLWLNYTPRQTATFPPATEVQPRK